MKIWVGVSDPGCLGMGGWVDLCEIGESRRQRDSRLNSSFRAVAPRLGHVSGWILFLIHGHGWSFEIFSSNGVQENSGELVLTRCFRSRAVIKGKIAVKKFFVSKGKDCMILRIFLTGWLDADTQLTNPMPILVTMGRDYSRSSMLTQVLFRW